MAHDDAAPIVQEKGRSEILLDYHLRVGQITQHTRIPEGSVCIIAEGRDHKREGRACGERFGLVHALQAEPFKHFFALCPALPAAGAPTVRAAQFRRAVWRVTSTSDEHKAVDDLVVEILRP